MARFRFALLLVAFGCSPPSSPRHPAESVAVEHAQARAEDLHSYARPHAVRTRHLGLDWRIDFANRQVVGVATWAVERVDPHAPLMLDTRELAIERVETGRQSDTNSTDLTQLGDTVAWVATPWEVGPADPVLGAPLRIELPEGANLVRIAYRTSPSASGLQWLEPPQTADQAAPFLYSQAQAIHARSFLPCQDSPGVRITFDAAVEAEPPLAVMMAAEQVPPLAGDPAALHRFRMPEAIPSYLVAFAAGRLEFAAIGPRSGVWAEPTVLARATAEFGDVERMIAVAEGLYGPYRWGRYDILVLPPAFPFGGMENPRLTFATPTILAGDRSLVALIAHELAHSWSGNLVTNATWPDLWLNEGFTVYIERRIVEALYGRERAEMEAMLGRQDLERELAEVADTSEVLVPDLAGRDPDEALSNVAYEKGALFLRALEESYGRERFDPFLRAWFGEHAFTSQTTAGFEAFLAAHLLDQPVVAGRSQPDVQAWIHGPGLQPDAPHPHSDAFAKVDQAVVAFAHGAAPKTLETAAWTPHEWLHFLRAIPPQTGIEQLGALDSAYNLTASTNSEIVAQWLEIGVRHRYAPIDARLESFLLEVGRRKFLMPLYESLLESGRRQDAAKIYARARAGYHPITQASLDALMNADPSEPT